MEQLGDDGSGHSPIHGFAYDGYPIMGPFQDYDTLAVSCWKARDFSASSVTGCSDGTRSCLLKDPYDYTKGTTTTTKVGPSLTGTVTSQSGNTIYVTSGAYFEDYYLDTACAAMGGEHLDANNGHDHDGIGYHYHLTADLNGIPTFPYAPGPKYYGCLQGGSQSCGTSYLYGAGLGSTTASYGTGTSTCGTTTAASDKKCLGYAFSANVPTAAPTGAPYINPPTRLPTTIPPTRMPTVAPTIQITPIVQFDTALSLGGLTSATLDDLGKQAIIDGAAQAMGIDGSNIAIKSVSFTRRRLQRSLLDLTATYTASVEFTVTVNAIDFASTDGTSVYNTLTTDLQESVTSGALTSYIQDAATSYGSTTLASATATGVTVSTAIINNPPTAAPTKGPAKTNGFPVGGIIGIVIGGVVLIGIIIALIFCCSKQSGGSNTTTPRYDKVAGADTGNGKSVELPQAVAVYPQTNTANL